MRRRATFDRLGRLGVVACCVEAAALDGAETLVASEARLLAAISGGVMVGWGVTLWLVVTFVFVVLRTSGDPLVSLLPADSEPEKKLPIMFDRPWARTS